MHAHDPIGKKMNNLKDHHKHTKKEKRKKETNLPIPWHEDGRAFPGRSQFLSVAL
jgi:hypothetical protein